MSPKIIKIRKRGTVSQESQPVVAGPSPQAAARHLAQTVNTWVSDWQQRKEAEAAAAYHRFLGAATAQT